ncbi:unnamed protein product [Amaranthus hypochondriacus]
MVGEQWTLDTTPATQVQQDPTPLKQGRAKLLQPHNHPKSPLTLPTQGNTTEIYSTNASKVMIISTVEPLPWPLCSSKHGGFAMSPVVVFCWLPVIVSSLKLHQLLCSGGG